MKIDVEKAMQAMERQREYRKEYYEKNKDKVRNYHKEYNKARRAIIKQALRAHILQQNELTEGAVA